MGVIDLERELRAPSAEGLDRLQLTSVPLVPEIRLYTAVDSIVWWARMEAEAGSRLTAPYWASAWAGGQALARYLLDRPEVVAGRKVLDLASGSGLAAIAAALAGAVEVEANDVDPYAITAIAHNARANRATVTGRLGDLLDGGTDADVVLAGDVLYQSQVAERMLGFLQRAAAGGAQVLLGDPDRGHLPPEGLTRLACYRAPSAQAFVDAELEQICVYRLEGDLGARGRSRL
ncbi:50S ribosomal protein L11 methyltransferase [Catellatospora sp. KI3]|uniref:class I SAM-dependent methyltransferase n=1 Tax=Catellatospora sp. KI3 TaxID=3041620 RepID=UPI00248251C6|nr:50S ribosomal protein L11 methyltransferase [Catellatospora sp. KI3]MDI1462661.1 50S ribosomal protein L11 methyltransferase [Catellatospora sp. KI3]